VADLKRANLRRNWSTTISKATDNLTKAGWTWGSSSHIALTGRVLFTADTTCYNGTRFIVSADEMVTAFLELERQVSKSIKR
jgi:hypothetical protein